MNVESIIRAAAAFTDETYGHRPNTVRMHPRTWEKMRITAEYGSALWFYASLPNPTPRIYGMDVVEDMGVPEGEARVSLERDVKVYIPNGI